MSRSIVVILNASAGTAESHVHGDTELRELFQATGCPAEVVTLRPGESPVDAARAASAHASVVVAAGGDGTVSSVAAGIFDTPAALGVLPVGTLNHFAKDVGIPLGLREAVDVVATGEIAPVDVGLVNDRLFVNNSSIGVYPNIVVEREELRRRGHRKFTAMLIATLNTVRRYPALTLTIEVDGQVRTWRTPFLLVGNNKYAIEGLQTGARARLDEGKLFVYLAPRTRTRDLPLLVAASLLGRASESGAFTVLEAADLTVRPRAAHIRVALDGEVVVLQTPLRYRSRPGALRVVRPRTAVP